MKTNKELLAVAIKQLGNGGSKYRNYVHASGNYCDMFVYWLFNANGCASLLPWPKGYARTYCPSSIRWCNKNLAQIPLYLAMPSDIIYFDWEPNGNPNHIGIVEARVSTSEIKTIEGNTSGKKNGKAVSGIVARKTRTAKYVQGVYRPHFQPPKMTDSALKLDGAFEYKSIFMLQKLLGMKQTGILDIATVKKLQTYFGAKPVDGAWGKGTSKAVQTKLAKEGYYTGKIDSDFGPASAKGLQRYINAKNKTTTTKPTTTKPTTTKPTTTKNTAKLVSYRIDIDLTNQICTVYGVYDNKSTKALMSEFISSARKGYSTPTGNFKISSASGGRKAKARTAKLSGGTYGEYLCRFHGGKCMHTVPWKARTTTGKVYKGQFNKLGTKASGGCVRMPWKLAKYIYEKCPVGTPVRVFNGKAGSYPMGKPKKYTATTNQDPTYKK